MRYGFLSDVHGNLEALTEAVACLRARAVERVVFLGDAVGYGANPNEVCAILRDIADVGIVGNHDAAVTGRMDYEDYYDAARNSLDWCAARLSPQNMRWLEGLPYKVAEGDLVFCHGAPIAPEVFDYIFGVEHVLELLEHADELASVTFIGHSHLAIAFRIDGDQVTPMITSSIECDPDAKFIITVGSVGQPRDRDPRLCCGVFDTESRRFEYVRRAYDVQAARHKIIGAGLSSIFGDRLLIGV